MRREEESRSNACTWSEICSVVQAIEPRLEGSDIWILFGLCALVLADAFE